jgi:acyl-CoA synthetase (NDP forming)
MAGDHAVMRTHVEHAGVILVESLEELGDVVEIVALCPVLPGGATGVVAESGAFKAMMLDLAEQVGLDLPRLGDADSPALRAALPPFVPVSNPLDVTAQGLVDPGLYGRTIAALAGDARIDTIVVTLIQTVIGTSSVKFAAVAEALAVPGMDKPVVVAGVDEGGGVRADDIAKLRGLGVSYLPTAERALRALARIASAARVERATEGGEVLPFDDLPAAGATIPEYRSKELLGARGVAFPTFVLARGKEEALAAAERLGYPVVLKAQAAALPHKSDAGGVIVGLADAAEVAAGWDRLHTQVGTARPDVTLDGVLVERMAPRGVELIVGGRNDPAWGPVILIGSGGVAAELLHDARLLPIGLSQEAIVAEIGRLKLAPLLQGFRGAPVADVAAVARIVSTLGEILVANPAIREVDLNPVVVYPKGEGAIALDALISL